jgi:hypothetical protein
MRKALISVLTAAVVALAAGPLTAFAQAQFAMASLAGRSVDPAGRSMAGERVELLNGTTVVSTTTTNGLGEWSFKGVQPGVYTVRMNVRGRVAGIRVTVEAGQALTGTMVVVPAATASLQLGLIGNLITLVPAAATAATTVTATTIQEVETVELSPTILVQILEALPVDERQAFAAAVVAAVQDSAQGSAPFAQYEAQFQVIANTGTVPPPSVFTPPVPVS